MSPENDYTACSGSSPDKAFVLLYTQIQFLDCSRFYFRNYFAAALLNSKTSSF